jgi:hypothetical protein
MLGISMIDYLQDSIDQNLLGKSFTHFGRSSDYFPSGSYDAGFWQDWDNLSCLKDLLISRGYITLLK